MGREPSEHSKQVSRFLETARAFGCDADEAATDEKLKGIAEATSRLRKSPTPKPKDVDEV